MHKTPKLMLYLMYVRSLHLKKNFPLNMIGALDETPVWLDMEADTTLDFIGKKSIPLKTTGHEKSHVMVALAAKAEATIHRFQGQALRQGQNHWCRESSWMNENLTHEWLKKVHYLLIKTHISYHKLTCFWMDEQYFQYDNCSYQTPTCLENNKSLCLNKGMLE